ncbi:Spermidine synthase [Bradyrhizobium canariense]|uniref:Spermidine synthase n=1 Tax=Bradyrhizobium canariense TaxID=255045 RepID=A0A1H1X9D2_9BRAD|nr:Spermidine synthase [Bradyrhizobium canariense]
MNVHDLNGEHAEDVNYRLVRIFGICLGILVLTYSVLALRLFIDRGEYHPVDLLLISTRVLLGAATLLALLHPRIERLCVRQIGQMSTLFEEGYSRTSDGEKIRFIVLVTMAGLLLELVMIRWLASVFPVFSFFKNFTLLACFLGLGAGYAVADKQRCAPALVLPMLALFVAIITLLRYDVGADTGFFSALPMLEQTSISIWMDRLDWLTLLVQSAPLYLLLATSFILCACICYPVGQLGGKLLHSAPALKAYSLNLLGSILGVAALFVMSLFWLPPVIWFTAIAGILLFFVLSQDARQPVGIASFCLLIVVLSWPVQPEIQRLYSPYQLLERMTKPDGLMNILSGGSYYQKVFNLPESNRGHESEEDRYVRAYYEFPFNFKKKPERVAIVGAGSGNDVAAALRMGASHVDAIEIDPAIVYLGKNNHPEHPYDDPRVTVIVNDARNFFRTTHQQYDLIIYGVLDSHTALSHASNLRVDSYVYTREGITEAFKLLKPDGVISISFALPNESLGYKLSHILQGIPGAGKPLSVRVRYDSSTTTAFVTQKGRDVVMPANSEFAAFGFENVSEHFAQPYPEASIPTDDWPFFYMISRTYPVSYMIALGMVMLLSYMFVRRTIGLNGPIERSYLPFFFLGSGFMLVETKAITELGLHLGGTWFVIAATIILVLVMAFLANLLVQRKPLQRTGYAYFGLLASLVVGYFYARNHDLVVFSSPLASLIASCVLLTIPMFFSGIVFSSLISRAGINISTALSYNLMGALFGGLMEYNSMYFGFAFLYLLAAGFYFLAWVFSWNPAGVPALRLSAIIGPRLVPKGRGSTR